MKLLITFFSLCAMSLSALGSECKPAAKDSAVLKELRPRFHTVDGPLAEFDPCHRSVKLQKPFFSEKPALMIVVHGGGGVDTEEGRGLRQGRGRPLRHDIGIH